MTTRWVSTTEPGHSQRYVERFRALAADGADLAGEARFLDAMIARRAAVLDAGCGSGRVAAELAARGHRVVGVDADPVLIDAARTEHPALPWFVADLSDVDLTGSGELPGPFDAVILAGNVMVYLAPGSEGAVLSHLASGVRPDGVIVTGFATDREYGVPDFDNDARAAGLVLEHRFATWDLRPWRDDASFAVTVLRRPAIA
jgi:2-polyprenyl-3-methyl-5-hydroxy-6-metoxy-1,4-benzoquinol methylase